MQSKLTKNKYVINYDKINKIIINLTYATHTTVVLLYNFEVSAINYNCSVLCA